jgi:hypothetical protein
MKHAVFSRLEALEKQRAKLKSEAREAWEHRQVDQIPFIDTFQHMISVTRELADLYAYEDIPGFH